MFHGKKRYHNTVARVLDPLSQPLLYHMPMKTILVFFSSLLLLSACSSTQEEQSTVEENGLNNTAYINENYGFQLTFPETWLPVTEEEGVVADGAISAVNLIGGDQVIQIGSVPLYLRSIKIGVYPIADKEVQLENKFGLYNQFLGENENYAFFYESELLYMYPYACKTLESEEEERLCEEYKPAYEDTQLLVTSFAQY